MARPSIRFLGAAGTVTGSRFLVESGSTRVLIDCGMFQGRKELRQRNWAEFPVDPASIDAVVVSHAHLDHVGYLPRLVADGFSGSIHATRSTTELSDTVLRDSGRLHEADAERANRRGYTKHQPALPLYTEADAINTMRRFVPTPYETRTEITPGVWATFRFAGHILGSASVTIEVDEPRRSVVFWEISAGRSIPSSDHLIRRRRPTRSSSSPRTETKSISRKTPRRISGRSSAPPSIMGARS